MDDVDEILAENRRRRQSLYGVFDPLSGEGSIGPRTEVTITGLPEAHMWLPDSMMDEALVRELVAAGSVAVYCSRSQPGAAPTPADVVKRFERLRCLHDFPYWAARYVYIKCKGGGDDVLFRLTHPQRKFVDRLEQLRRASQPIRIVLLKARQWGGSTTSQLYMAWLQMVHRTGLNSLIIAHQGTASDEIRDMFDRMIEHYPIEMLYDPDDEIPAKSKKTEHVGRSGNTIRVIRRNCKIKIGTAERPDSCRGGDYNLVHLSEVGLWRRTAGKKPEDIVRAACAGVLYRPDTMIVYESTANGIGNFFHREYLDARDNARSQFRAFFVSWMDIEQNTREFANPDDDADVESRRGFARWLLSVRHNAEAPSNREESGRYLWWLWQRGATLEGINWYIMERAKHTGHGSMAAECPTDDVEAFVNSGAAVFDKYHVEALRGLCRPPRMVGEVGDDGIFTPDSQGSLWIWQPPETDATEVVSDRYLTVVDVGGRSDKADWSVIVVFDRINMIDQGRPQVVAQWRGHIDIDLLTLKAAAIAGYYDRSLLVIESNTLETHDRDRQVDGDQSHYILNSLKRRYPNLYARRQSEDAVRQGLPRRYGFHTNIATKPMIISTLVKVVREHLYVERDERCLNEMIVYERKPNGSYGAIIGEHDDMLMTRAIGLHICYYEMPVPQIRPVSSSAAVGPRLLYGPGDHGPLTEATLG